MNNVTACVLGFLTSVWACAGIGLAQDRVSGADGAPVAAPQARNDGGAGAAAGEPRGGVSASVEFRADYLFRHDLDDSQTDVSVQRYAGEARVGWRAGERGRLGVSARAAALNYDFSDGAALGVSGKPWGTVLLGNLGVNYAHQIDDQWGVSVGATVLSSGEQNADFSDTLTYGGFVGASYRASDSVRIGLGLAVLTRLEDDATVVPFPSVDWQIDDRWRLTTDNTWRSAGVALRLQATDDLALGLEGAYVTEEFRLSGDDAPGLEGFIGSHAFAPLALTADWRVHPQVTLLARVGAVLWQEYELENASGDNVAERDGDAAPFVGLGVQFTF